MAETWSLSSGCLSVETDITSLGARAARAMALSACALSLPTNWVGAVDHHLRRVVAVEMQNLCVLALAGGELVRGEAIVPAERLPVVDVLFEPDDVGGGDRLLALEAGEQSVGGWATGAALGGDELHQDGGARGPRRDAGFGGGLSAQQCEARGDDQRGCNACRGAR